MDKFEHKTIQSSGINLHVAEIGSSSSPAVLFLHGFPEIWYTWRHQMIAVANAGYRAITFDYRGYGLSDVPAEPEKASYADFVRDIATVLESLGVSKVFVIGKDFGAMVAYTFVMFFPEKVSAIVTLCLPFIPRGFDQHHLELPEGFYIRRWEEPGRAEADFDRFDAKTVVRNIYILFASSEMPIANENQEIMDMVEPSTPLPSWFTEEDLEIYGALYEKSGFRTAIKVPYRSFLEKEFIMEQEPKIEVPALFIMGEEDYVMKLPGLEEYVRGGEVKKYVPNLDVIYLPQGSHFAHEQFPDKVNQFILTFLDQNKNPIVV